MRCDTHVHIVGLSDRYEQIPARTYLASPASLEELQACAATQMISRFVLVQPSFYGTDNTLLLESLDQLGAQGRGVAVLDPTAATPRILAEFSARGVRGLRINLYSPLGDVAPLAQRLKPTADCARTANWHVEVIASIQILSDHLALLSQAEVPIVIDHYGLYGKTSPDSSHGRKLLELLGQPHVWIKLSAPYRNSNDPLDMQPNMPWLNAILAVAEDRCVWGSDWPHTPPHSSHYGADVALANRALSYPALVDDFLGALGSKQRADRIMRDNPGRLYDFPNPA
jgi:predicted TIM-barrel fold metal-dependent hydrolase